MVDRLDAVKAINSRLKAAGCNVSIRGKGKNGYLYLRATLPLRDGAGMKQQEIPLHLPPSVRGLKLAEAKAHELHELLITDRFKWELYRPKEEKQQKKLTRDWIAEFKSYYFATHALTERTWLEHWAKPVFDRLPQEAELKESILMALILQTDPGTRLRKHTCQKLQKLATFAGLTCNLIQYQGDYGLAKTEARYIPSEAEILESYDRIMRPSWKLAFSLLAAFGLRPHEAFFCEFIDSHTLRVREGKTGERIVSILPPEWSERFGFPIDLTTLDSSLPAINKKQPYQKIGLRVTRQFARLKIEFTPYSLRHAYGIRATVRYGLPVPVSAAMMGHSNTVHLNTYLKWMNQRQIKDTYKSHVIDGIKPIGDLPKI